jgi:Chromate transporter
MAHCGSTCQPPLPYPRHSRLQPILQSLTAGSPRFISLGLYGILYSLTARRLWIPAILLFLSQYAGYAVYVVFRGVPSPVSLALGIAKTPSLINLFVLGLVAGTLSFGGAYTAIPFVQVEAVLKGAWLPQSVFIDCIAIGNILPAPLVIFATFVGFQGGLVDRGLGNAFAGAVVITLGMFFPCFIFTIAGHTLLEKLVRNKVRLLCLIHIQAWIGLRFWRLWNVPSSF